MLFQACIAKFRNCCSLAHRPRLKAEVPHTCIHGTWCLDEYRRRRYADTGIKSWRVLVRSEKVQVGNGRYQQAGNSCLCQSLCGKTRVRNLVRLLSCGSSLETGIVIGKRFAKTRKLDPRIRIRLKNFGDVYVCVWMCVIREIFEDGYLTKMLVWKNVAMLVWVSLWCIGIDGSSRHGRSVHVYGFWACLCPPMYCVWGKY